MVSVPSSRRERAAAAAARVPATIRRAYSRFVNSDEVEWAFELCNKYAVPFLVVNLVVYTILTTPILSIGLVLGILVHEAGHYTVQRWYGYEPDLYVFPVVGAGISEEYEKDEKESLSAVGRRDIFLAGPAAELIFSAVMAGAYLYTGRLELFAIAILFPFNAMFNLLPVWEVDGGKARTVQKTLARNGQPREAIATTATHTALVLGNIALAMLLILSLDSGVVISFLRGVAGA